MGGAGNSHKKPSRITGNYECGLNVRGTIESVMFLGVVMAL